MDNYYTLERRKGLMRVQTALRTRLPRWDIVSLFDTETALPASIWGIVFTFAPCARWNFDKEYERLAGIIAFIAAELVEFDMADEMKKQLWESCISLRFAAGTTTTTITTTLDEEEQRNAEDDEEDNDLRQDQQQQKRQDQPTPPPPPGSLAKSRERAAALGVRMLPDVMMMMIDVASGGDALVVYISTVHIYVLINLCFLFHVHVLCKLSVYLFI
jgi:hypothetical protein